MRKMICSGLMAMALVALSAVPVLANNDEEVLLEDIRVIPGNLVSGVGFDIIGYSPMGTYGTYRVHYTISY